MACTASEIDIGGGLCEDAKFTVTTTNLSSNKTFQFVLSATGTFYVDWGDTLIRHFVPVPTGLVIGNYTVPENGMFDIVTQTFYANPGAGNFQYGKEQ